MSGNIIPVKGFSATIQKLVHALLFVAIFICASSRGGTFLVTTNADDGPGSLRQAINAANADSPGSVIQFGLADGFHAIQPLSQLPPITNSLIIDGWSQPGFAGPPIVALDGSVSGTNADGLVVLSPSNLVRGLVIHSFPGDGIVVSGGGGNVFQGNTIGTDAFGTNYGLGNMGNGIDIQDSPGNIIGGLAPGEGNLLSGNTQAGLVLGGSGCVSNLVEANFIGTDASGTRFMANFQDGIVILNAPGNLIGGLTPQARNIISGNVANGIAIVGGGATNNIVEGNYCGVDATGEAALENYQCGVYIQDATFNLVGGAVPGAGNLLSANLFTGVTISGVTPTDASSFGNVIQGNWIGLDATGTRTLGNATDGISIFDSPYNVVGGTNPAARNVSSGNGFTGLYLDYPTTVGTVVIGNYFGVAPDGVTPMGNAYENVQIDGAILTRIGGVGPGEGNLIAYARASQYDGVRVHSGTANSIRGNSIYLNAGEAVDLGPNGPNSNTWQNAAGPQGQWQNYPVLKLAVVKQGTRVSGSLNSYPSSAFLIDIYADTEINPDGYGEGRTWLGFTEVRTDDRGDAVFDVTLPKIGPGQLISATATGPDHSTSEFCKTIPAVFESSLEIFHQPGFAFAPLTGQVVFNTIVSNLSAATATNLNIRIDYPPGSVLPFEYSVLNGTILGDMGPNSFSFSVPALPPQSGLVIVTTLGPPKTGWFLCTATLETGGPAGSWSQTAIAVTQVIAQYQISASAGAQGLSLGWIGGPGDFQLQETASLAPPVVWSPLTNLPVFAGGTNATLTLPAAPGSHFFRLIQP